MKVGGSCPVICRGELQEGGSQLALWLPPRLLSGDRIYYDGLMYLEAVILVKGGPQIFLTRPGNDLGGYLTLLPRI